MKSQLALKRQIAQLKKVRDTKKLMVQSYMAYDVAAKALSWVLGESTVSPMLNAKFTEQAEKMFFGKRSTRKSHLDVETE